MLLDDDILLTASYSKPLAKEDPYLSNAGRPVGHGLVH